MLPDPERLDGQRGMLVVRHGDENRVATFGGDKVAALGENAGIGQFFGSPLAAALLAVGHGHNLDIRAFSVQDILDVGGGNVARADDAKSKFH